jgi:hypothetical protein
MFFSKRVKTAGRLGDGFVARNRTGSGDLIFMNTLASGMQKNLERVALRSVEDWS